MSENNEPKKIKLEEIENPALVYAMYEMKEKKTREAEAKFIEELKKATFISPAIVQVKGEDGEFHVAEDSSHAGDTRIQFMMLTNDKKEVYLPAFTSMDEVRKWRSETKLQTVVCRFEQYMNIIASDPNGPKGLAIDAFGSNIMISRTLIEGLKKVIDEKRQNQVEVKFLEHEEIPEDLREELNKVLSASEEVKAAHLHMMKRGDTISYLLIVDHDIPEGTEEEALKQMRKALFDKIAADIKPALKGRALSIAGFENEFGKQVVDNKEPFYTR